MNDLFQEFNFIHVYIYVLLALTNNDWEYHLTALGLTLTKIKQSGFKFDL